MRGVLGIGGDQEFSFPLGIFIYHELPHIQDYVRESERLGVQNRDWSEQAAICQLSGTEQLISE